MALELGTAPSEVLVFPEFSVQPYPAGAGSGLHNNGVKCGGCLHFHPIREFPVIPKMASRKKWST